jgi:hypothetical protein
VISKVIIYNMDQSEEVFTGEKYIVSCGNYEGGLLGLSFKSFD